MQPPRYSDRSILRSAVRRADVSAPHGVSVRRGYPARMAEMTRRSLVAALPVALVAGLAGCTPVPAPHGSAPPPAPSGGTTTSKAAFPTASSTPGFDRTAHSLDDPSSRWIVVDKRRPLTPRRYAPPDLVAVPVPHTNPPILRKAAAGAVVALFAAAASERRLALASNSTYRPYSDQQQVYAGDRQNLGRTEADRLTLRPGYSEHQTGFAIDIGTVSGHCDLNACLGNEPEGRWLAANAWRFGFVLRYPADREHVTGIEYEPWHFRYLGASLARELHETKVQTLEEFFGLPPSPSYA